MPPDSLGPGAMRTDTDRLLNVDAIDERTLKPVVKFLLVAGALFLLWGLVSALPGVGLLIPTTSVTIGAAIGAGLTLALVATLGYVAWALEDLLREALEGPTDVAEDFASLAKHLVLFVAVLVAHRGLAPLVVPGLAAVELAWAYDPVFLLLALVPTTVVVLRMLGNVGEVSALITARFTGADGDYDGHFARSEG